MTDKKAPKTEELDNFFTNFLKLIKAILLMPYLLYLNVAERFVKFFFKFVFHAVKITEKVPIVGPRVSAGI